MFFDVDIVGDRLPPGTLCFTYDDGPGRTEGGEDDPGPRTGELGAFLHSEGVPASFFAVGKNASEFGCILAGLRSHGHLVANHTYDHLSLPAFVAGGGDVRGQLARTDEVIRDHVEGRATFFRAPYGDWRLKGQVRSNVAADLNRSALATNHVGPIGWDIDAGDVGFWRDGRPAEECVRAYLEAIECTGRGIVLMHDSTADIDEIRLRNRALGLARGLVPELRRRGYRFMRLDAVPQVASAARVSSQWTLVACDGSFVSVSPSGEDVTFVSGSAAGIEVILGVVDLGANRWALRGANGLFLSPRRGGEVIADALSLGEREVLTVEHRGGGRIALRTLNGSYLTRDRGDGARLLADAPSPGERGTFRLRDPSDTEPEECGDGLRESNPGGVDLQSPFSNHDDCVSDPPWGKS
jgi:peptidoglycan/xylan/chitin deacetylase (PgdA/CDA1 family)